MKNFQITAIEDGKKYWIGRSIAVSGFIFKINKEKKIFILANKRGKGLSNHVGLWNCPCGYLDWDESGHEAVKREVFEECGLELKGSDFLIIDVETSPLVYNQNVSIRYLCIIPEGELSESIKIGNTGEVDEVSEVKWIPYEEIDNYEWAFNHNNIIKTIKDSFVVNYVTKRL